MRQQILITSLTQKPINTKFGQKNLFVVNGNMTAFYDSWNATWQVGQTIDVEVEQNGKYINLKDLAKAPREVLPIPQNPELLAIVNAKVNTILEIVQRLETRQEIKQTISATSTGKSVEQVSKELLEEPPF